MKKLFTLFALVICSITLMACGKDKVIKMELIAAVDTVEINTSWTDAKAKVYVDDVEQSKLLDGVGTVDTTKLGAYTITYSYDANSKIYEIKRVVNVVDRTAPVLTLNAGLDTIYVGDTWVDAGVTITDNSLESIAATITGSVDNTKAGTNTITYKAIDSSGNEQTIVRYVTVLSAD